MNLMKNFQFSLFNFRTERGFTLIEIMTALSIFAIIMTVSMGSILGIFSANRQARDLQTVMSNLSLALESMSKEMRYGTTYHCGSGNVTTAQNCAAGDTLMSFLSSENVQITYELSGTTLEKRVGSGSWEPVTAPNVTIDSLSFYTLGAGTDNLLQPKVLIKVKAHVGDKNQSSFTLQTLVSQRLVDI
jgi:prepilin-type N-terminal cleavage/methylation domain-containing protein